MPVNPFLPYGNTRNSKTSSRAIAAMPPQGSMPQFNGIGSLPSPFAPPGGHAPTSLAGGLTQPVIDGRNLDVMPQQQLGVIQPLQGAAKTERQVSKPPTVLYGGTGSINSGGRQVAEYFYNQKKTKGKRISATDTPPIQRPEDVYKLPHGRQIYNNLNGPGPMPVFDSNGRQAPVYSMEDLAAWNNQARLGTARAENLIEDPHVRDLSNDAAYVHANPGLPMDKRVQALLGGLHGTKRIGAPDGSRFSNVPGMNTIGRAPDPKKVWEPLPDADNDGDPSYDNDRDGDGFQQRIPQMADPLADPDTDGDGARDNDSDGDGFRMRRPEYDNSIPGFAPVANGGTMPGGPMDEHGYNPGFDPYQQYNMPQYNQGADPFYKGVNDVAMGGLDNKQYMDKVRREDWERDRRNRGWDEFAGGFLTPLQSMFVKDNGARQNMLAGGQAQAARYQQSRQLRDAERRDQFGEDKYYTDLRQANDPNSYENWLAGQNARTSRLNAQTGVNNSRTNEAYRQQMAQNGAERNDINQAFNQWRMQHGDSMESRRAFESAWRMSQGQQRIDNQASQFQTNAGFRQQEIGLKSKMLEMQGQRLQAQMEQAQKAGDLNQQRLLLQQMQALANLYVIDPKTGEPKFANEAFELFGAQPPQKPEAPEPEPGFLKQILNGFKLSEPAQSAPKAEPTVKTSKLNKGTLSKIGRSSKSATTTKYDQNNARHQALIAEAFAKYPNDKESARRYFLKRVGK